MTVRCCPPSFLDSKRIQMKQLKKRRHQQRRQPRLRSSTRQWPATKQHIHEAGIKSLFNSCINNLLPFNQNCKSPTEASAIRAIITRCRVTCGQSTGDLHLITIDGYTIGADCSNDLVLADLSPFAAWVNYDPKCGEFMLHPAECVGIIGYEENDEYYFETSEPIKIVHGMSVELGYNIIEMHLHPPSQLGQSETCDGEKLSITRDIQLRTVVPVLFFVQNFW